MQMQQERAALVSGAWLEAERRLMDGEALRQLLTASSSTWNESQHYFSHPLGDRCLADLHAAGRQEAFFQLMAKFAEAFRRFEAGSYRELGFEAGFTIPPLSLPSVTGTLSAEYVGAGHFGLVFKLRGDGETAYALKVFYRRNSDFGFSGPYSEAALGAFITANRVCDMPHLCLADPGAGWMITQFVDERFTSPAPLGPSAAELGLSSLDAAKDCSNLIRTSGGGIFRVDYGHLTTPERETQRPDCITERLQESRKNREYLSADEFLSLFHDHPESRLLMSQELRCVAARDRFHVLERMCHYPEMKFFPIQDYLTAGLFPASMTTALFDLLMRQSDPRVRGQAVFDVRQLPKEDQEYLFFFWRSRAEFLPFRFYLGLPARPAVAWSTATSRCRTRMADG